MNGIIIVDKKKDWTSQDILTKIKKSKKFNKIGHAGTLDPLATGVMVVMINEATKLSDYLMNDEKEYLCEIIIGKATDTEDSQGNIISETEVKEIKNVDEVLNSLVGKLDQIPPMYSALHHNGVKLYELARRGIEVEREKRLVEIFSINRTSDIVIENGEAKFSFITRVSKGTYIRTLCVEIGNRLGFPAYMNELRRLSSGNMRIEDASTLDDVLAGNFKLINMLEVFKNYKIIEVDEYLDSKIKNGMKVKVDCDQNLIVFSKNNDLYAIYEKDNELYRAKRIWM